MEKEIAEVFLEFFEIYNKHFENYAGFLAVKQNKILLDDLKWLESNLQEEQKYIMKGNSLEEKRLALFERAGISGTTLSQLMEMFPEELKPEIRLEADRLQRSIDSIKRIAESCDDIVKRKMEIQSKIFGISDFTGTGAYNEKLGEAKGPIQSDDIGRV